MAIGSPHLRLTVGMMSETGACALLSKAIWFSSQHHDTAEHRLIKKTATELTAGLPLAIAQVGAFIRLMPNDGDFPMITILQKYVEDYQAHEDIMLRGIDRTLIQEYDRSVLTTFDKSFSTVKSKDGLSGQIAALWYGSLSQAQVENNMAMVAKSCALALDEAPKAVARDNLQGIAKTFAEAAAYLIQKVSRLEAERGEQMSSTMQRLHKLWLTLNEFQSAVVGGMLEKCRRGKWTYLSESMTHLSYLASCSCTCRFTFYDS